MPSHERSSAADALTLLGTGDVELEGRLPWSSNATFLATVSDGTASTRAVYKPVRGERALWDFPPGLFRREVAAYAVSECLGWQVVPETVVREDAPLGVGSLQRFVEADFAHHYFTLLEEPHHDEALRLIATFDLVVNNADRKSGHCLLDGTGRMWAVDHGLCFHAEPKLRTVMWDFAGEAVPDTLLSDIERVGSSLPEVVTGLLDEEERQAVGRRCAAVLHSGRFPDPPDSYRAYPWPLV